MRCLNFHWPLAQLSLNAFLDKLESEGKEDWQIRQAYRSIKF